MTQKLLSTADVTAKLQNVQVYPAEERVEINDKFSKIIFRIDVETGKTYGIIEKKNFKPKNGKGEPKRIVTGYKLSTPDADVISLSEFDRAVLSACISEQKAGNLFTTINIIFRSLVGQVGKQNVRPKKNQRDAIAHSLKTLMETTANFGKLRENLIEMGYLDENEPFDLKRSSILPAVLLDCKINGQPTDDVLFFDRTSPLLEIAEVKNQIVRYPAKLLDVPDQNNTPLIISLKTYVLRRIAEIKLHKQMTPTVTFDDVFTKCRIEKVSRDQFFNYRKTILQLFQHLKNKEFISDFEILKRGVSVYGVNFQK